MPLGRRAGTQVIDRRLDGQACLRVFTLINTVSEALGARGPRQHFLVVRLPDSHPRPGDSKYKTHTCVHLPRSSPAFLLLDEHLGRVWG